MPRFLYWNYRYDGPDRGEIVAQLVQAEAVDVLILVESSIDRNELAIRLGAGGRAYGAMPIPHDRVEIFAGYPTDCFLGWVRDEGRLCLRRLKFPGHDEILLGAVHLASGLYRERAERKDDAEPIARAVREAQRDPKVGHSRTVLVGDFNLNPFDDGMVFPNGFGAMMTKSLVRKYPPARFYNPMWSRLGREVGDGPPGTYYWDKHRPMNTYWNYPDQVLIGPDLLDHFPEGGFRILTAIPGPGGDRPLIRETHRHWKIEVSDHLPILFELNLPPEANHA